MIFGQVFHISRFFDIIDPPLGILCFLPACWSLVAKVDPLRIYISILEQFAWAFGNDQLCAFYRLGFRLSPVTTHTSWKNCLTSVWKPRSLKGRFNRRNYYTPIETIFCSWLLSVNTHFRSNLFWMTSLVLPSVAINNDASQSIKLRLNGLRGRSLVLQSGKFQGIYDCELGYWIVRVGRDGHLWAPATYRHSRLLGEIGKMRDDRGSLSTQIARQVLNV